MAVTKKTGNEKTVKSEAKDVKTSAGKTAAKPAAKRSSAAKAPSGQTKKSNVFVLQFAGSEYDIDGIKKRVDEAVKKSGKKNVKSVDIYVKPEDRAVYYVINGKDGSKIDL